MSASRVSSVHAQSTQCSLIIDLGVRSDLRPNLKTQRADQLAGFSRTRGAKQTKARKKVKSFDVDGCLLRCPDKWRGWWRTSAHNTSADG
jgi:hypothetical protein